MNTTEDNMLIPERHCRWCADEGSDQAIRLHEGGEHPWWRRVGVAVMVALHMHRWL